MHSAGKPTWQQMTALVSLSTGGAMTGFSLVSGTAAADLTSPAGTQIRLLALRQSARPAAASDAPLRSAIVNVANYYLRMAQVKTPAEMEALIWQHDSIDGVDHGASCAAFASLTLELAAQVVGQQSWVTGGTSYPWPLHKWADVRVDPNPASPGIISVLQDAQAHQRWHAIGDGYLPLPGDWVLFAGHVEVVTSYSGGVLRTVGGDSLPNLSVNAHEYANPLSAQGVTGFVNNGGPSGTAVPAQPSSAQVTGGHRVRHHHQAAPVQAAAGQAAPGQAAPGGTPTAWSAPPAAARPAPAAAVQATPVTASGRGGGQQSAQRQPRQMRQRASAGSQPPTPARTAGTAPTALTAPQTVAAAAAVPGTSNAAPVATLQEAQQGAAVIPGLTTTAHRLSAGSTANRAGPYTRHQPAAAVSAPLGGSAQQAFISQIAPGAIATQSKYGVPAAVTIAQAIDESGWGQSVLASKDHNLFGIKGAGPAGSDMLPTQEFQNGQIVSTIAPFRVYHNLAQSIDDHGKLLATSGYYSQSMAQRQNPNAFAAALTGVYATDPGYGARLISLMQQYQLYRYNSAAQAAHAPAPAPGGAASQSQGRTASPSQTGTPSPSRSRAASPSRSRVAPSGPGGAAIPGPGGAATSGPGGAAVRGQGRAATSGPGGAAVPGQGGGATSGPGGAASSGPGGAASHAPSGTAPSGPGGTPSHGPGGTASTGLGAASIPGLLSPAPAPATSRSQRGSATDASQGPGSHWDASAPSAQGGPTTDSVSARRLAAPVNIQARKIATRTARARASQYQHHIPPPVKNAFVASAREPLTRAEPLYRDVASHSGIRWELLAACDWMQCRAKPRYSPVHGEKLGTVNADGTSYRTKSAALEQCADDLVELAGAVYRIDLTASGYLSVRDLANVFAAFRWGGLLKMHRTSAMEFPYSAEGLTVQHMNMRWPNIAEPHAPDKPGGRFHMPFGAVPVVLGLGFAATV